MDAYHKTIDNLPILSLSSTTGTPTTPDCDKTVSMEDKDQQNIKLCPIDCHSMSNSKREGL